MSSRLGNLVPLARQHLGGDLPQGDGYRLVVVDFVGERSGEESQDEQVEAELHELEIYDPVVK